MGSGPAGADDGASARDGKWAWSSIEMSELKMAGGEGKGGIKVGGLGDSLAGVPCHSPPDRQGVRDQNQGAASSGKSPAHEGGALSSARSPHPQLPWLCPVRVAASLKPKAAPLCAQLPIVPPSSFFSPNTHTHTHSHTHPQLTSRPEALLPNPATSTLFHTVPPADLPLFSPLLNSLPHRFSCSLGLDSLHYHPALKTNPFSTQGYICFFAFEHSIVPQGEQSCSGELCRLYSHPKDSRLCHYSRGAEQQQIQLLHKDHTCIVHLRQIRQVVILSKPVGF